MVFMADDLLIRRIAVADLPAILEIYKQCEDFLSLGPVSTASIGMVQDDIAHSVAESGVYCLIIDSDGNRIGVIDFTPEVKKGFAVLSLLMISKPYRHKGIGTKVMKNLEAYLAENYNTTKIDSGVQINNEDGIRFWTSRGFHLDSKPICQKDGTVTYDMSKDISLY